MAVPELMLGSFQMETSEGFDEFMYEMGVNMFTRLIIMMRIIMDNSVLALLLCIGLCMTFRIVFFFSYCHYNQEDSQQPLPTARDTYGGRRSDVH